MTAPLMELAQMDQTKKCFKCERVLPVENFYRHPRMTGGRVGKCKTCNKADVTENRNKRIDYYREYDRARGAHGGSGNKQPANKTRAWNMIQRAVAAGKIKRPEFCERCGSSRYIHAHHDDYAKPLDVLFLCAVCHKARHKELGWGHVWNEGIDNAG